MKNLSVNHCIKVTYKIFKTKITILIFFRTSHADRRLLKETSQIKTVIL